MDELRGENIAEIGNAAAERLGIATRLTAAELDSTDAYIGQHYGVVTDACREALRLVPTEGSSSTRSTAARRWPG